MLIFSRLIFIFWRWGIFYNYFIPSYILYLALTRCLSRFNGDMIRVLCLAR